MSCSEIKICIYFFGTFGGCKSCIFFLITCVDSYLAYTSIFSKSPTLREGKAPTLITIDANIKNAVLTLWSLKSNILCISSRVYPLPLPVVSLPVLSELTNFLIFYQFNTISFISRTRLSVAALMFLYCLETFLSTRYFIMRLDISCCGNIRNDNKSIP